MGTFQTDVMDAIAKVIGGTPPDAVNYPRFFSGVQAADGSGVAGIKGCYSAPPESIPATPMGLVLIGQGRANLNTQGFEENWDDLRLLILIDRSDPETQVPNLAPFRDLVPAALRSHMELYGAPNTYYAFAKNWKAGVSEWSGVDYYAIEFTIEVFRGLIATYTA